MHEIRLRDFTLTPGPASRCYGDFSGEEWRESYLIPAYIIAVGNDETLLVDLDGVIGFSSSFIEASFGGLVRSLMLDHIEVLDSIRIACTDEPDIVNEIAEVITKAWLRFEP